MPGRKGVRGIIATNIACMTLLLTATSSTAAPGDLDESFSGDGKQRTDFNGENDTGRDAVALPNDKVVIAGDVFSGTDGDFAVARYRANGSLDPKFAGDGRKTTDFGGNDEAVAIARQPDGKLVLAGSTNEDTDFDIVLARYKPNGKLDKTFSRDGKVKTNLGDNEEASGLSVLPSGKIIVGGHRTKNGEADFLVLRYNSNGKLDTNSDSNPSSHFKKKGWRTIDFPEAGDDDRAEALDLRQGMITLAGLTGDIDDFDTVDFAFARLSTNGDMDNSFGEIGRVAVDFEGEGDNANDVKVLGNGKTVAAGQVEDSGFTNFGFVRVDGDGTPDDGFDDDGEQTIALNGGTEEGRAFTMEIQAGKYLAAGQSLTNSRIALVRLESTGELDDTFGDQGEVETDIGDTSRAIGSVLDSEGRLVIAGAADNNALNDFAVARYLP